MKLRLFSTLAVAAALGLAIHAQNAAPPPPQSGQVPGAAMRGMGAMGMNMGPNGRGVSGTVTEAASDRFTIKTFEGETYTVRFGVNTRFMKQQAGARTQGTGQGQGTGAGMGQNRPQRQANGQQPGVGAGQAGARGQGQAQGQGQGAAAGNFAALTIKATDIKVGDTIAAMGEIEPKTKSIGAMAVVLLDAERAKQAEQLAESFGKTWLMGKVTKIEEVEVTIDGSADNKPHKFVANEDTTFRQQRNPITLADIKVGDMVRAEGAVKDGVFTATTVTVMSLQGQTPQVPRANPQ